MGTTFAWDLRWQQQPVIFSGTGIGAGSEHSISESEVWEVQYDRDARSTSISNFSSSSRMLPVMMCSEDGILAVLEQGMDLLVISDAQWLAPFFFFPLWIFAWVSLCWKTEDLFSYGFLICYCNRTEDWCPDYLSLSSDYLLDYSRKGFFFGHSVNWKRL